MISKKLVTSSLIYIVSSALSTVASFVLLPYYTNTGLLTVSDYGALVLYMSFTLLVQALTGLCIDFYVGVTYQDLKNDPQKLKEKIASLNGYIITAGAIILIVCIIWGNFIIDKYVANPNPSAFRYMIMAVITGIFNAHFKFHNSILINTEQSWKFFWSNILNFVTTIAFSLIILHLYPLTLEGPMWGRLLSGAAIFAWSFGNVVIKYGIAFRTEFIQPVFRFCSPLLLTVIFQWILGNSYGYLIKRDLLNANVGIFDLAVKFTLLINFVLEGIGSAITPRIFALLKQEQTPAIQKEVNKYYSSLNLVALLVIPGTIFLLPIFVPVFLSSPDYLKAFLYFGLVGAGIFTLSIQTLFVNPTHFHKQTIKLLWVNGIAAVLQVALSYLMIKHFKLYGAAFSLNIIKVLQIGLLFWLCRHLVTPGVNIRKMVVLPLTALVIISIGDLLIHGYGWGMHFIHAGEMLIIGLLALAFYRHELIELWNWGKKKFPVLSSLS